MSTPLSLDLRVRVVAAPMWIAATPFVSTTVLSD